MAFVEPRCGVPTRRANRAGPSRYARSFYNHFQSKDELFHAAVKDALDTFGARSTSSRIYR